MSNVQPLPGVPPAPVEFRYTQTDSVPAALRELGASLVITTYQANKLLVARATEEGLSMLVRTFDRPMGLAMRDGRVALGCRNEVWEFRNAPAIAPLVEPAGRHDACFVPRSAHVTGDIAVHEFHPAVEEIFDVLLLVGFQFPEVMGFQKDTLHHTFIVPDPAVRLQTNWTRRRESPEQLTSKLALRGGRAHVSTI